MSRFTHLQSAFARGEISPLAYGRSNLAQYQVGLSHCLNAIIGERGELHKRPGTRFVAATKGHQQTILIPFRYSTLQSYIIEAGPGYLRFYINRGQLMSANNQAYEISTPYSATDLSDLRWVQIADILFLVHPSHPPQQLSRTSASSFSLNAFSFNIPVWQTRNTNIDLTMTMNAGLVTAVGIAPFEASHVGRTLRIFDGVWKQHTITAVNSSSEVTVYPARTLPNTDIWQLGAFWTGNYPSQVVFHEDRLVFAATPAEPQTFWTSQVGDYSNFANTEADGSVIASNAITGTLNDYQVNKIHWMTSLDSNLLMGTESGIWVVRSANAEGLAPDNVQARRQHATASADAQAVLISDALMFLNRAQRKLYSLRLDNGLDHYTANDETLLADHMLYMGADRFAYQESPHRLLWVLRRDGSLATLTYDSSNAFKGWSKHQIGGSFQNGPAVVESIASIPKPSADGAGAVDDLWLVVKRQALGTTIRYIEHLESYWDYGQDLDQAVFVDASASYDGLPVGQVGGLEHLYAQEVTGLADGLVIAPAIVDDGPLSLPQASAKVHVGLAYPCEGAILDIDKGGNDGSAMGKPRQIFEALFKVWRSWSLKSGHSWDALRELDFGAETPTEFSGDLRLKRDEGGWARSTQLVWRQDQPYPLTLLSLGLRIKVEGG